jgi:hypothetical protein
VPIVLRNVSNDLSVAALRLRSINAVFILALITSDSKITLLGNAFAVETSSKTIAVTCSRWCIYKIHDDGKLLSLTEQLELFSRLERNPWNGELYYPNNIDMNNSCFIMKCIHLDREKNIALLQIDPGVTASVFPFVLPVAAASRVPKSLLLELKVAVYQFPIVKFCNFHTHSLAVTESDYQEIVKLYDDNIWINTSRDYGSRGAPMVLESGEVIRVVLSEWGLPNLPMDMYSTVNQFDHARSWIRDYGSDDVCSRIRGWKFLKSHRESDMISRILFTV